MTVVARFYDAGRQAYKEGKTAHYVFALANELENRPNFGVEKSESYLLGFFEEWVSETRQLTKLLNSPLVMPDKGTGDAS